MNTRVFGWDLPAGVTDRDIDRHFGSSSDHEFCRFCEEPLAEFPAFDGVCRGCEKLLCAGCGRGLAPNEPEHRDQDPICPSCARRAYPRLRGCGFAAVTAWAFACGRTEPPIRLQPWWASRGLGGAR